MFCFATKKKMTSLKHEFLNKGQYEIAVCVKALQCHLRLSSVV